MTLLMDDDHSAVAVSAALAGMTVPMFVARYNAGRLTLGTLGRKNARGLKEAVQQQLHRQGLRASVAVVTHDPVKLRKIKSLEGLISRTGRGTLVFDRTKALQRSEAMVDLAARLRAGLGSHIRGVFCQSERRTLFVVLSPDASSRLADAAAREHIRSEIAAAEAAWREAIGSNAFDIAVRVGSDLPRGLDLIAVDRRTVRWAFFEMLRRPLTGKLGAAVVGSIVGTTIASPALATDLVLTPAPEQSEPAVDEANLSVTALTGVARDPVLFDHLWAGLSAKATMPLGERFGAQLDLGVASDAYYGAALHLFARDPAMGLVGLVGSAESQYGVTMNRIGAEVEYYLSDQFTLGARVGYQGGGAPNGAFGRVDIKFYPDPNLALTAGAELQPSFALGRLGFEWRPAADALPGMSISADASASSNGNYRAMFGLHFQLGGSDTILDRDRRSDPETAIWNQIDVRSAAYGGR